MILWRRRPWLVMPDRSHNIHRDCSGWYCVNDRTAKDILRVAPNPFGTCGTGVTVKHVSTWGKTFAHDGTATAYNDLISTNRFIAGTTTPFTIAWIELHQTATPNAGIVNLFPSGGTPATKAFVVYRASDASVGVATYGSISVGPWAGAGRIVGTTAPPALSANVPVVFVVTCAGGAYSQTASDYTFFWATNSSPQNKVAGAQSGNIGAAGATQNYFGWDNANPKYTGSLDSLRVWNRILTDDECYSILADPWIGCVRPTGLKMPTDSKLFASPIHRWFLSV